MKDVTLYAGSFLSLESLQIHHWWWNDADLCELMQAMEEDHEAGNRIRRLRIVGRTDSCNLEEEYQHAKMLAQRHGATLRCEG